MEFSFRQDRFKESMPDGGRTRASVKKRAHLRVIDGLDFSERTARQHFSLVQHHRLIGDHLDTAQFVRDDNDRHVELPFQSKNEFVQLASGNGIQAG
jgi:hypothetical protein